MTKIFQRPDSSRPLRVEGFIATRLGDPERGPLLRMRSDDARARLIVEGELVVVHGPRRQQLAPVVIDDTIPRGGVVVRDIAGIAPSELVYVTKPDLDTPPQRGRLA